MRTGISKLNQPEKTLLVDLLDRSGIPYHIHADKHLNITIRNLCADSRKVQPGDFFVAVPCPEVTRHTTEAIDKGASVILTTAEVIKTFSNKIPFVEHSNPRLALGMLAKAFFQNQPEVLIAVTGTNGKSSVVSMIRQFWEFLGHDATSFGTLGVELNKQALSKKPMLPQMPSTLNTYDSLSFFHLLQSLACAGINHAVFEASSHGLDQYRIHGCQLSVAGFTNLTQDHLDYHQTMEEYLQAKVKLFTEVLPEGKTAVLNADSPYTERIKALATQRNIHVLTYAINTSADLTAVKIKTQGTSIIFDLKYKGTTYSDITLNLSGVFQVENALCAIGMLIASGISLLEILPMIPKLKSVAGRMELIGKTSNDAHVYVDYAHTPDALERALKSLRLHTLNSVWVVFGCGGDRDAIKRPLMGKIASNLADNIIITDDNPRSENPASIRQQILSECHLKAYEIADRRQAIAYAIAHLEKGDTLLIAGKGHETGQIIQNEVYPFSDRQEAEEVLIRLKV